MEIIPFDKRDGYIWFNGKIVNWQDAKIHVLNHGLHYGSSVFEGIRIYQSKIFMLKEHSERLIKSAELIGMKIPYSLEEIMSATEEIVQKQGILDGYIRPICWRGSERMTISAKNNSINLAIACWSMPINYYNTDKILKGIKLTTSSWVRPAPNSMPTASKTAGMYTIGSMCKHLAEDAGFDDALMLDYRGFVAETTSSNIFFIFSNQLHTPIADCFLNGITRQVVLDIAKKINLVTVERYIRPNELANATEIFVTGTAAEITPVSQIDQTKYHIGDNTKLLIESFKNQIRGQLCLN